MRKKEEVRICDQCRRRAVAEDTSYFGGHPFWGWLHVEVHGGLSDLESLRAQKEWDFCGKACAIASLQGVPPKPDPEEVEEDCGSLNMATVPTAGQKKFIEAFRKAVRKKKK